MSNIQDDGCETANVSEDEDFVGFAEGFDEGEPFSPDEIWTVRLSKPRQTLLEAGNL